MNKIKKILEQFNPEEQKLLKEEYHNAFLKYNNKYIARNFLYQKAYQLKTNSPKILKEEVEEYIPNNYIEYNNYRIIFEEVKNALYCDKIEECLKDKKYGYVIYKALCENDIDIYSCDKVSIVGVK